MRKYNVLIIGAGNQGALADAPGSGNEQKIISFAHAFKEHPGFNLLRIDDINLQKAWKAMDLWGCVACYHLPMDVVVVTTPDDTHYGILKQLAKRPLKLVICEKPICNNLDQAREIVELYKAKGIPLMVNYTRRFLPYYDYLKDYGNPKCGICRFNRGWLHTGTHAIDFFNMIGCEDYELQEVPEGSRVWNLVVSYEHNYFTEIRVGNMPVWGYYDKSHWHIVKNAYNFLEGKEKLKCTGEHGLKALEICYKLMEGAKT